MRAPALLPIFTSLDNAPTGRGFAVGAAWRSARWKNVLARLAEYQNFYSSFSGVTHGATSGRTLFLGETEAFLNERAVPLNYSASDLAADNATLEKILLRP